ncbi:MAG: ATP-binding cassette domain-containing protein [Corynebacterium sp.]|nr:ATP-binding cassette domain-containing protein [Corynebacterium sp.]
MEVFQTSGCLITYKSNGEKLAYQHAVKLPQFTLSSGQKLAIIGPSGSGKSTISSLILGETKDLNIEGDYHRAGLTRAWAGQDHYGNLNPRVTVSRHLKLAGAEKSEIPTLLGSVQLPANYASRYPTQLSGGERARVGLAICLAKKPELLVIDELTSSFDTETTLAILKILKEISRSFTVIFITHDRMAAQYLCDSALILNAEGEARYEELKEQANV